jgi:predicted nucleic acid-binding protein
MMLIDSNIIIYAAQPENDQLLEFIRTEAPFASEVSRIEVLGYPDLDSDELKFFEEFFNSTGVLPITEDVINEAIRLRQIRRINLGDSLIAATALANKLQLMTNNTKDFKWISNLTLRNPLES